MPPEEPPCDRCRVDPLEENRDALRIFFLVRYQFIMGFEGPIDINHLAIDAAMKREGVEGAECFTKVLALATWWIGRITRKD
jgi:hypothetical protein